MRFIRSRNIRFKFIFLITVLISIVLYIQVKNNTILVFFEDDNYDQLSQLSDPEVYLDDKKSILRETTNHSSLRKSLRDDKLDLNHLNPNEIRSDLEYLNKQKAEHEALLEKIENDHAFKTKNPRLKINKNEYLILEYTKVFFQPKFCDKTVEQIFNSDLEKCEFNNCKYSCDRVNDLSKADALIFHQRDLEKELIFDFNNNTDKWLEKTAQFPFKTAQMKLKNNPDQVWILWNDEATTISYKFNKISNLINWTLSYKTNAEVFEGSYGFFKINSNITSKNLANLKKEIYTNHFKRRHNAILWFVSNCDSKLRSQMALELSKYYPVYIYGRCNLLERMDKEKRKQYPMLKIVNFDDKNVKFTCERNSKCEAEKLGSFKYYLAFENTNCSDYVTEKVWRSLSHHLIPIVLQPNRESYRRYSIPAKSFIHMQDFDYDVQNLSEYLHKIDSDFNKYYDHLKWTYIYLKSYSNSSYTEPHRMCQLCKRLNTNKQNIYYNKIADFFNYNCRN